MFCKQRNWYRIVVCMLLLALISTSLPLAAVEASQVPPGQTSEISTPMSQKSLDSGEVQPEGAKSYLVKQAVKVIASAIRYGGDALEYIVKYIDDDAARALNRYSDQIADKLDYIATIPDLTANIVKDYIFNFMVNNLKIQPGLAMQIADAIKAAINWLIF